MDMKNGLLEDTVRENLRKAIEIAGSQRKLGKLVERSQNAITYALRVGRVNPLIAHRISRAVKGAVRPEQLCPELREVHNRRQPLVGK